MKAKLKRWVLFYKAYRQTLIQPVVHLRRPDMQSWDGFLHVHPEAGEGEANAVAMLFNPTERSLSVTALLPLYYAGVGEGPNVSLSVNGGPFEQHALGRGYDVILSVEMRARSVATVVVRRVE